MNIHSASLFVLPKGVQTRWATAENQKGLKGGACVGNDGRKRSAALHALQAGESFTMAEVEGVSGMLRRIWITLMDRRPKMLRGIRLDIYWDGAQTPAVSAPLGDFFCQGPGRMATFENVFFSNPEGRSFNCCVPMPFQTGMKVVVTNETDDNAKLFFYEVDYTTGDAHEPGTLYFHAHWHRENPTALRRDFEILPLLKGRGRFLGANLGVIGNTEVYFKTWWGEGEVKVYLDGDTGHPTLSGTGTEDYIGTAWGQGVFSHAYQGCPLADEEKMQYSFYRFHVPDPVYFQEDIRVTIQQIGCCWTKEQIAQLRDSGIRLFQGDEPLDMDAVAARGFGIFERSDDWSSCSYFYLDQPISNLPPLAPYGERVAGLL